MSNYPKRGLTYKINLVCNSCDKVKQKKKTQKNYIHNNNSGYFKSFKQLLSEIEVEKIFLSAHRPRGIVVSPVCLLLIVNTIFNSKYACVIV